MTTEILVFVVGMMIAVLVLFWFLISHFMTKYGKDFRSASLVGITKKQLRTQRLNTVVDLVDEEKRAIKKRMWMIGVVTIVMFFLVVRFVSLNYWRFVVTGVPVQATITNVVKHRSSGRRSHTSYTYTLHADVRGALVTDTYDAGSSGEYRVGEVVDAYADVSGTHVNLAIANVEKTSPLFSAGIIGIFLLAIGFILSRDRKNIRTGKAKILELPSRFRSARLTNLLPASAPTQNASNTLPTYTIGGNHDRPKDNFPQDF